MVFVCVSFSGLLCLEIGKKKKEKEKEKKNEKKIIVVVVVIVSVAIFVYYVTFSLVNFRHYQHLTQKHIQISQLFHFPLLVLPCFYTKNSHAPNFQIVGTSKWKLMHFRKNLV